MKVKFYILQRDDETGKTREKFLFTDDRDEMFTEKQIMHKENKYQVKSLEWSDEILRAVCIETL